MKMLIQYIEFKRIGENPVDRFMNFIEKNDSSERECDSFSDCSRLRQSLDLGYLTPNQAHTYLTLICEKYPEICELNQPNHRK